MLARRKLASLNHDDTLKSQSFLQSHLTLWENYTQMSQANPASQSIPNHTIDPATGFIESNGFLQAFDSDKKQAFLTLYRQNGLKFWRTCAELGVKGDTVHKHASIDPEFKLAIEHVKREFYDELEGISRENALNPRSVIERIFQLKAAFPDKYGDNKRESAMQININFDGKALELVKKRSEIIDAETINSTPGLTTGSGRLSDSNG